MSNVHGRPASDNPTQARVLGDLTVIIPTVGRPILQECLQGIAEGTALPGCIIVVDQGADKETVERWLADLERKGLQTVHLVSSDRNPGLARNLALAHVKTALIAAVDDDCVADRCWLEAMHEQLRLHPDFIITGRVNPAGGHAPTLVTSDTPKLYREPSVRLLSPLSTCNMGFALRTALQIGPFDGRLFTAEDNDWAYRALRAKVAILYAPGVIVQHHHWRNDSQLQQRYLDYAWGQGSFYGKHLRHGDPRMFLMTAISLYRGARDLLIGWLSHDDSRRLSGSGRMRLLLPGVVHGFLTTKPR